MIEKSMINNNHQKIFYFIFHLMAISPKYVCYLGSSVLLCDRLPSIQSYLSLLLSVSQGANPVRLSVGQ